MIWCLLYLKKTKTHVIYLEVYRGGYLDLGIEVYKFRWKDLNLVKLPSEEYEELYNTRRNMGAPLFI